MTAPVLKLRRAIDWARHNDIVASAMMSQANPLLVGDYYAQSGGSLEDADLKGKLTPGRGKTYLTLSLYTRRSATTWCAPVPEEVLNGDLT